MMMCLKFACVQQDLLCKISLISSFWAYLSHSELIIRTAGFPCNRMECFSLSSGIQLTRGRASHDVQRSMDLLRLFYISIGFDFVVFNSIGKQAALLRDEWSVFIKL